MTGRDVEALEALLHDLVRLLPDDARVSILDGVRLRRAALALARLRGIKPSPEAVRGTASGFRRARGLHKGDDLEAWCADRGIDAREFVRLMTDEATLGAVGAGVDDPNASEVADFLRVVDGVDNLWTRARLLRDTPREAEVPATRELLHAWYETRLGTVVPDEIEDDAWRRGFEDVDDLVRALARTAPATQPRRAETLAVGDPVPDFVLRHPDAGDVRPDLFAGRWWALVLVAEGDDAAPVRALEARLAELDGAVITRTGGEAFTRWPTLADPEDAVRARCRPGAGSVAVLVDPGGRVASVERVDDVERVASALAARVKPREWRTTASFAPVLTVPVAFEEDFCRALIARWEEDHDDGAVTALSTNGAQPLRDERIKRRRDHVVRDGALEGEIRARLARRVFPEVRKAFQFEVTSCEGFRVGCYDARDAGFFGAHRDDANPMTAGRRFALTVNLDHGTYDGGKLRMPEYDVAVDAPTGTAVVYSASILHEVEPVTRGRRFALVGFFSGQSRLE